MMIGAWNLSADPAKDLFEVYPLSQAPASSVSVEAVAPTNAPSGDPLPGKLLQFFNAAAVQGNRQALRIRASAAPDAVQQQALANLRQRAGQERRPGLCAPAL